MKFPFAKPETLTDAELDEIAASAELTQGALLERARRIEAKAEAEAKAAAEKADAEERARVDALLQEHRRAAEDARREHADLGEAIVIAGGVLERRDGALREVWRLRAALKDLGVQAPAFDLAFGPAAMAAGRRLAPFVDRELAQNPLSGAYGAHPEVFR